MYETNQARLISFRATNDDLILAVLKPIAEWIK